MDLILLEPGNGELVFGKAPDGDKGGGIDATWRDAAALRGMGAAQPTSCISPAMRTARRPTSSPLPCATP